MTDDTSLPDTERRGFLPALLIAVAVLIAVMVIVFLSNPRETSQLEVLKVNTFAPHMVFPLPPGRTNPLAGASMSEDNLYVIATVRMTDKLRLPLFLLSPTMTLTNPDGTVIEATAVSSRYYPRLEASFPSLTGMLGTSLSIGDEIDPGESHEGCVLLVFPGATDAVWQNKRSAVLKINLRNQPPQTIELK